MFPDSDLRVLTLRAKVSDQSIQGFSHVTVAQVPGFDAATKHRAVILFGILYEPSVLLCEEEFILRHMTITIRVVGCAALHLYKLVDDFALARFGHAECGGVAVGLRVLAEVLKA